VFDAHILRRDPPFVQCFNKEYLLNLYIACRQAGRQADRKEGRNEGRKEGRKGDRKPNNNFDNFQ